MREAREKLDAEIAVDGELTPGVLLDERGDAAAIVVRVEAEGEPERRAEDRDARSTPSAIASALTNLFNPALLMTDRRLRAAIADEHKRQARNIHGVNGTRPRVRRVRETPRSPPKRVASYGFSLAIRLIVNGITALAGTYLLCEIERQVRVRRAATWTT